MKNPKSSFWPASCNRRNFFHGAASVSLGLAAVSSFISAAIKPTEAANWRGLVGCIIPQTHESGLEDTFKLLPPGIGLLPVYMNFNKGTKEEMQNSLGNYENNVAYLASQQCDLICVEGAPPFMILGREGETRLIDSWELKYKTPMFTTSQNALNAFKALKSKNILGVTAFSSPKINKIYGDYFVSGGYNVVAMDGMLGIDFNKIQDVPDEQVYTFIKRNFLKQKGADTIYILGGAWDLLDIVEPLEQDLGVSVVHPIAAQVWEIQKRLHVHQPVQGYGQLLATLPA